MSPLSSSNLKKKCGGHLPKVATGGIEPEVPGPQVGVVTQGLVLHHTSPQPAQTCSHSEPNPSLSRPEGWLRCSLQSSTQEGGLGVLQLLTVAGTPRTLRLS
jgi:hypothetical protein